MQEQTPNGTCCSYVYDPAETWSPLARIDHQQEETRGAVLWFSTDLNGAPLELTDAAGKLSWSGQYGSFGVVRRQTEGFYRMSSQPSLSHQPLRYAMQGSMRTRKQDCITTCSGIMTRIQADSLRRTR
ncbi:RHS domain-containing protein [Cronobacter dublinensis]|nr:RHS domain-containing protein [Cronobacter dublinensis]